LGSQLCPVDEFFWEQPRDWERKGVKMEKGNGKGEDIVLETPLIVRSAHE